VEEDVRVLPAGGVRRPQRERSGEPLAIFLRAGTAADHIKAVRLALAQLSARLRRWVLIS
jgi:hypothetical protein